MFTPISAKFITSAAMLALIAGFSPVGVQTAHADDCLLDTNHDGDADSNVDTDGGADSGGINARLACGHGASAMGSNSTALGRNASAAGADSTALGEATTAAGDFSSAFGRSSSAAGDESTVVGYFASGAALASTVLGSYADATGLATTALGRSADAAGDFSTAVGSFASADGLHSTSLGYAANNGITSGADSIALGRYAQSIGANAIAIGSDADATNVGANAAGSDSIVIGADAGDAGFAGAIVIGAGAIATEANQVVLKSATTFTILGNGDVGMGTAAPLANLDVNSGANDTTLLLNNTGAQWEMKSKAATGRLVYKNLTVGGIPFKLGPTAVNGLLSVGTVANDMVDIRGDLEVMGTLTTGGPTCGGGCDAVFGADYDLPSIEEHAVQMYANSYLPEIGPTVPHAPVNLSEQYGKVINELEKAHIYIAQQDTKLKQQEKRLDQQSAELKLIRQQIANFINP